MVHNQGIAFCSNELLIGSSNDSSIHSTTGQRIQMKLQFKSSVCRSMGTRSEVRAPRLSYSELVESASLALTLPMKNKSIGTRPNPSWRAKAEGS